MTELVEQSGVRSTDYQNLESAKEFADKCVQAAENWTPVADRLWNETKCAMGCAGCQGCSE